MSTILKSLRKLEQEKEARQYTGPVSDYRGPGSVSVHGTKQRWFKSPWLRRGFIALVILVLGSSSLYFYQQSQEVRHKAESQDPPPQLAAKNTVKSPQQKKLSPTGERPEQVNRRNPAVSVQKPAKKTLPPGTAQRIPPRPRRFQPPARNNPNVDSSAVQVRPSPSPAEKTPPKNNLENRATQPATPPVSAPPDNRASAPPPRQTVVTPVKKKPVTPPAESYQNVSTLTDGRLKVQAIVWSRIPEDRMTVINSRVLHEGDSVDGFTLVVIRPDDVVVKESGGSRWKVMFGRP